MTQFLENILAETKITKLSGKSLVCVRIQLCAHLDSTYAVSAFPPFFFFLFSRNG